MASTPQHCPSPRELDDLELLTNGALAPLTKFNAPGSPITLTLPPELESEHEVELVDPEGLPLATYYPGSGTVSPLTQQQHGPFRELHLTPERALIAHRGRTIVPITDPLTTNELNDLRRLEKVALLVFAGTGSAARSRVGLTPNALIRATLAAARELPNATVIVVPLAAHDDAETDHQLGTHIAHVYAGTDHVHALPDREDDSDFPDSIATIIDEDQPAPDEQGLVIFFTGLSGSGKSTLAQALMDRIIERGVRSITSLDGDVVRRNLSAGLTFSKEDRETNIRRIGWVAAEIARHRGVAVCSPIAPFDSTRQDVRRMVQEAGGAFFLVHVSTPLEECERRDRKGLYAKARRGEIPEFTGISSPYEVPEDASVRVDTTGRTIEAALDDVIAALAKSGYLDLTEAPKVEQQPVRAPKKTPAKDPNAPLNVLFVCTANICRSAYMNIAAKRLAGDSTSVEWHSAGTLGFTDSPIDAEMGATIEHDGTFRSRPLTAQMVRDADLILTAQASHRGVILDEHPAAFRRVFTLGQFAKVAAANPDLHGRDLIRAAGSVRDAPDPADDIQDPYRRGMEVAELTAGRMSSMLEIVVPALVRD